MRILLVQQFLGRYEIPVYPVGIHVFYNYLTEKDRAFEIDFFDMNKFVSPYEDLSSKVTNYKPDLVGISLRNIDSADSMDAFFYLPFLGKTLETIKKINDIPITIGGPAFSLYAAEIMTRYHLLDFGIFLEGEESFLELLKNTDKPESVKGIFYRKDNIVKFSGVKDFINLSASKSRIKYLVEPKYYKSSTFGIESKRGCILNCAYCRYVLIGNSQLRLRAIDSALDEIEDLVHNQVTDSMLFVDPIFNIPIDHARQICDGIIERKLRIKWSAKFNEKNFDADFAKLVVNSGCTEFVFSPDGYNNATLRSLNKNISTDNVKKIFNIAKKTNRINISLYFVRSPPEDSLRGFLGLLFFLIQVKLFLRKRARNIFFKHLRIEPDTELYSKSLQDKVISLEQNLLPKNRVDLKSLFYKNPRIRYIDTVLGVILFIRKELRKGK
jgi:anaerobic magnesium-protoporphyrin IX monomethyl ester cyclase